MPSRDSSSSSSFLSSLIAGGIAGTSVDVILFPLDTLKTRLQSGAGFLASGGFRGLYHGLGPAFLGSAPNAAIFFCTYDTLKSVLAERASSLPLPQIHMIAASIGEVTACLIRVPVEVIKQRRQVSAYTPVRKIVTETFRSEGPLGFYRGYLSTLIREIPFSIIQFPLWEGLKQSFSADSEKCSPLCSSLCGAVAGGVAAALTTPLDVAKTRIMLASRDSVEARSGVWSVLKLVYLEKGAQGLFAGVVPRTMWISFGGAVFFGVYGGVKALL